MSIRKGSRYERVRRFVATRFGGVPFAGTRPRRIDPADGVLEHTLKAGERLDLLALHYYNDDRKWWRILDANPMLLDGGDFVLDRYEGTTIVIPRGDDRGRR